MPRNGSGTYTLPESPFVPGTTIASAAVNADFSDIATALTGSLAVDGQADMTGQLKGFGGTVTVPGYCFSADLDTGFYSKGDGIIGVTSNGVDVGEINEDGFATADGVAISNPIGQVTDFAGSAAPDGWLLCYGQAISRTTYALLFAIISTTYGVGDAVTTFNLPDCRGRASFGKDDMGGSAAGRLTSTTMTPDGVTLGATGGAQTVTLAQANLPNVTLTVSVTATLSTFVTSTVFILVPTSGGVASVPNTSSASAPVSTGTTSSINGNVAQTAVNKLPPAIIFNKIIFTGV